MQLGGAGDRHDPGLLRQQPGERDLRRRRLLSAAMSAEQIDQRLVCLAGLRREARDDVAEVGAVERRVLVDRAGEKSLAERAEGNEADAEFLERRQDLLFGLAPPQRILALQRRDRLHRMGAADRLHAGFGQAEVLDLALLDQVLHRAGHVFDRHVRIDAVLVEEIDALGPQPLERGLGDLLGCARAGCPGRAAGRSPVDVEAELGRDHHLVAERARAPRRRVLRW